MADHDPSVRRPAEAPSYDDELIANVRPPGWQNPRPDGRCDLLIIGAGPCGLTAARAAAALGARVTMVESVGLGGTSLRHGSVPTKALMRTSRLYGEMHDATGYGAATPTSLTVDSALALERVRRVRARVSRQHAAARLAAEGIALHFGAARFVAADAAEVAGHRLPFRKALIATGSQQALPPVPGLAEAGYLTKGFFDQGEFPRSALFIGGGPLVCEAAQALCRLGSRTLIVNQEPLFLPREERDAAQMISDALARDGVEIHLNTDVLAVRRDGERRLVDVVADGVASTLQADAVFAGTGRTPVVDGLGLEAAGVAYDESAGVHVDDFLRTSNPRIYAAGDVCLEDKFDNTAQASARIAVSNALLRTRRRLSALTVAWCTYTDPEIAHVGIYVRQARERGIPVTTYTVPMHEVDRAIADGEEDGFVKLHVRDESDRILGATIVARHAGEMINVITLAMEAGVGLRKLSQVICAYPTQARAIQQAADAHRRSRGPSLRESLLRWWLMR